MVIGIPKFWTSPAPTHCQLCNCAIVNLFIDGRVKGQSSWACMCNVCHSINGVGLGDGKGQKFEKLPDGRWLKGEE